MTFGCSSDEFHESGVRVLSLVVSNVDLGVLPDVVLISELDSVLVHSLMELVLLEGPSLFVGGQVLIRGFLGSLLSVEILLLSLKEEGLGDELVISLELGVISGFLGMERSIPGSLLTAVGGSIFVVSAGEGGKSTGLGRLSSSIGISGSLGGGSSCGVGEGGDIKCILGSVVLIGFLDIISSSFIKGRLIIVIRKTLIAPRAFTAVVLRLEDDGT